MAVVRQRLPFLAVFRSHQVYYSTRLTIYDPTILLQQGLSEERLIAPLLIKRPSANHNHSSQLHTQSTVFHGRASLDPDTAIRTAIHKTIHHENHLQRKQSEENPPVTSKDGRQPAPVLQPTPTPPLTLTTSSPTCSLSGGSPFTATTTYSSTASRIS